MIVKKYRVSNKRIACSERLFPLHWSSTLWELQRVTNIFISISLIHILKQWFVLIHLNKTNEMHRLRNASNSFNLFNCTSKTSMDIGNRTPDIWTVSKAMQLRKSPPRKNIRSPCGNAPAYNEIKSFYVARETHFPNSSNSKFRTKQFVWIEIPSSLQISL